MLAVLARWTCSWARRSCVRQRGEAFGFGLFGERLVLCDGEAAAQLTYDCLAVPLGREIVPICYRAPPS